MKRSLQACYLLVTCLIISCNKNNDATPTGPGNNPNPGQELPEGVQRPAGAPIPGTLVQKEIGAQGGEIVLGQIKFVFPAGALNKPVTFKVQQLENTAPNGIDSLAYRFETPSAIETAKPVKVIYTLPKDSAEKPFIPGGAPSTWGGVAFLKTENGSTTGVYNKLPGKPAIDTIAGTASQDFPLKISNGKLDIASFLKYKLWINKKDGDTVSSTTVVCDDQINYRVTWLGIDDINDDDLFIPLPGEKPVSYEVKKFINAIYINGVLMGVGKPLGAILSNHTENSFTYLAPAIIPGGAYKTSISFTISVEVTAIKGDVSKYYLVSQVKLINENTLTIKGRTLVNLSAVVNEEQGRKHFYLNLSNFLSGGTLSNVDLQINDVFTGAGNYEITSYPNSKVLASATNGDDDWSTYTNDPETNGLHQTGSGTVNIATYDRLNRIVQGTYTLTLVRQYNGKVERTPVSGRFHALVSISQ